MATDIPMPMLGLFTKHWWVLLLRGIAAILFGLLTIRAPLITLKVLVLTFGFYALIDGVFSLIAAFRGWSYREDRWLLLFEGLIGLGAAFVTLHAPVITAVSLMFFIAFWALATGILRIVEAIRLRKEIRGEFWLALSGLLSVAFAFYVMMRPAAGALAMIWVIGMYALFMGGMMVALSLRLRRLRSIPGAPGATPEYRRAA